MSFGPVDRAIALALVGRQPTDVLGGPADAAGKNRGFASAVINQKDQFAKGGRVGDFKLSVNGIDTTVPLFFYSQRGVRNTELFPSVSYQFTGMHFNPERYIWRADTFRDAVPSSTVNVKLPNGSVVTGPSLRKVRNHPEPYDLVYVLSLWAKNDFESSALVKFVLEQFPARGALKTIQEDGTPKSWEMTMTDSMMLDDPEPGLINRDQHLFRWDLTYTIATHLDNTLVTQLKRTITSTLEIDDKVI